MLNAVKSLPPVRLRVLVASLTLLGAGCVRVSPSPTVPPASIAAVPAPEEATPTFSTKRIDLHSVSGMLAAFTNVRLEIPSSWEIEVIPELEAVNLYDPTAPGVTRREQSQVFLRHFRANDFLTLSTVTVYGRNATTVAGRPATTYIIEKKSDIPAFTGQPSWRNARHRVTDVRLSDAQPSEFLVIGQRPGLPDAVFDAILASLR